VVFSRNDELKCKDIRSERSGLIPPACTALELNPRHGQWFDIHRLLPPMGRTRRDLPPGLHSNDEREALVLGKSVSE
jgi:hypothetical protein